MTPVSGIIHTKMTSYGYHNCSEDFSGNL